MFSVAVHVLQLRLRLVNTDKALGPRQGQLLANVEFISFSPDSWVQMSCNFYVVFGNVSATPVFDHVFPIVSSLRFNCFLSVQPFVSHSDAVVVLMPRIVQIGSIFCVVYFLICESHVVSFMVAEFILAHVAQAKSAIASHHWPSGLHLA